MVVFDAERRIASPENAICPKMDFQFLDLRRFLMETNSLEREVKAEYADEYVDR